MAEILPALDNNKHVIHSQTQHKQGQDGVHRTVSDPEGGAEAEGHPDGHEGSQES